MKSVKSTDRCELSRPLSNEEIQTFIVFVEAERSAYIAAAIRGAGTAVGRRFLLAMRRMLGRSRTPAPLHGAGLVTPLPSGEESALT